MAAWAPLFFTEAFLLEHRRPANPPQPTGCSSAPGYNQGGGMRAAQDLCPWSFYQRHGRPGLHEAGEGHVQYLEDFSGGSRRLRIASFPMYSIYIPF